MRGGGTSRMRRKQVTPISVGPFGAINSPAEPWGESASVVNILLELDDGIKVKISPI